MDWAQYGVASLFNKIRNNGYQIAYLSARAIGQAPTTKTYLQSVSQEDLNLPGIHGFVVQSVIAHLISVSKSNNFGQDMEKGSYKHFVL